MDELLFEQSLQRCSLRRLRETGHNLVQAEVTRDCWPPNTSRWKHEAPTVGNRQAVNEQQELRPREVRRGVAPRYKPALWPGQPSLSNEIQGKQPPIVGHPRKPQFEAAPWFASLDEAAFLQPIQGGDHLPVRTIEPQSSESKPRSNQAEISRTRTRIGSRTCPKMPPRNARSSRSAIPDAALNSCANSSPSESGEANRNTRRRCKFLSFLLSFREA